MIKSFGSSDTEKLAAGMRVRRFVNIERAAQRKLAIIEAASRLDDIRIPPGNRLEKLAGDRAGRYSIRVNDQYRISFEWRDGDAYGVEIVDYH